MKRLITLLLFAFFAITTAYGQVQPNLPAGAVPFGTGLFRATDGDIWGGSKFDGYTNLGNWERVADSLGVKINWSDTTIIATKTWVAQQLNNLPPSGVLTVTGDGVDNIDPANPVLSYPDPSEIGALAPGDNISELVNDVPYLDSETDPVYSGDPASSITQNDIDAWDAKQDAITGAAATVVSSNLTPSRVLISNGSGKIAVSPVSSTELAFLDGVSSNVQDQLDAKIPLAQKGASNGVAPIGSDGKIPGEYLPSSGSYKGTWDASTNTPTLADGVGVNGDRYRVSVGGTQNLGSGSINFVAGDDVIYNGTVWQRSPSGVTVTSVFGRTGDIVGAPADVQLGNVDNTSDLDKPISTATQAALDLKEDAFSKGSLIAGDNITLSGALANRLVGAGDITVDVDAGSIGLQTLSLGSQAGNIAISGGNNVSLSSLIRIPQNDYEADNFTGGLNVSAASVPVNLPFDGSGNFIKFATGSEVSSFGIAKGSGVNEKLYFKRGTNAWETFASEEYADAHFLFAHHNSADFDNLVNETRAYVTGQGTIELDANTFKGAAAFYGNQFLANSAVSQGMFLSFIGTTYGFQLQAAANTEDVWVRNTKAGTGTTAEGTWRKLWHSGNFTPSDYLQTTSPAGSITQTDIDNWNEAASYAAPETVITTTVNFTINWQNDIAPGSGGKTYAELHGNHFVYSAFYTDGSGSDVNYSPAVKINRTGGNITTVEFADIETGNIIIK